MKEICMPNLGMTMLEGKVGEWMIPDGETVAKGADVAEVYSESGKLNKVMQAPADGVLRHKVEPDQLVELGSVIAVIEE